MRDDDVYALQERLGLLCVCDGYWRFKRIVNVTTVTLTVDRLTFSVRLQTAAEDKAVMLQLCSGHLRQSELMRSFCVLILHAHTSTRSQGYIMPPRLRPLSCAMLNLSTRSFTAAAFFVMLDRYVVSIASLYSCT